MTAAFFITLREGLEAALIVGIIGAYLVKLDRRDALRGVWVGVGAAITLSIVVGLAVVATVGRLPLIVQESIEGLAALIAVVVLTWMLFWMRRPARSVKGELQAAVDRAIDKGSVRALAVLAFIAVIREGLETSLFLVGQANSAEQGAIWVLVGALIGLAIAAVLGVGFYHGSRRLNLSTFFRWTGVALIFIAAGLLSSAVHELIEIGVITFGTQPAFDVSGVLPHDAASGNLLGQFLRAIFGYSATPEVTTFVVWLTYVVVVLYLFLRPMKPVAQAAAPKSAAA
ncbi:MAG TPA: iron uptake transporter permease EfeU [Patescibacteria group bacterium]|nr:iron uptake transporter permease EfeU [Patescibacteria group bacterium]